MGLSNRRQHRSDSSHEVRRNYIAHAEGEKLRRVDPIHTRDGNADAGQPLDNSVLLQAREGLDKGHDSISAGKRFERRELTPLVHAYDLGRLFYGCGKVCLSSRDRAAHFDRAIHRDRVHIAEA